MSYTVSYCQICGRELVSGISNFCPQCDLRFSDQQVERRWSKTTVLDLVLAFVVWGVSGGFILVANAFILLSLHMTTGKPPDVQLTPLLAMVTMVLTLFMHIAGFVAAWLVVTRVGKRSFWKTLGWEWHPRFKWYHACGLAVLMFGIAVLAEKILPHTETELEKLLKLGMAVRLMVAALAVLTAPLIEEIVYRGVVYLAVEGLWGARAAVIFVTALFAFVHVPQYWGSYAAITAIISLSLVLTLLRYWTGKLLPCVVTHLVFNGIQAIILLVVTKKGPDKEQTEAAFVALMRCFGLG